MFMTEKKRVKALKAQERFATEMAAYEAWPRFELIKGRDFDDALPAW
jgi:hypothetical protein